MEFRTKIQITPEDNQIDYASEVMLLGSCFSENIGNKFSYYKFKTTVNPFGILFHPKAIETFIKKAINQEHYSEDDLIAHNERYHCFDAHSLLSSVKKEILLANLNESLKATYRKLNSSTSHLIIRLVQHGCIITLRQIQLLQTAIKFLNQHLRNRFYPLVKLKHVY